MVGKAKSQGSTQPLASDLRREQEDFQERDFPSVSSGDFGGSLSQRPELALPAKLN